MKTSTKILLVNLINKEIENKINNWNGLNVSDFEKELNKLRQIRKEVTYDV